VGHLLTEIQGKGERTFQPLDGLRWGLIDGIQELLRDGVSEALDQEASQRADEFPAWPIDASMPCTIYCRFGTGGNADSE
jgi:hypothetical protein